MILPREILDPYSVPVSLIAILLVALKMTAKEALEAFTHLVSMTFGEVAPNPKQQTEKLKQFIEAILQKNGINKDDKLIIPGRRELSCKL
jgi:hypothetical protein